MVEVAVISEVKKAKSQAQTVLAAILDVHQPDAQDVCEIALVLFTYDRQHAEVREVTDSYVGRTRWMVEEMRPADDGRDELAMPGGDSFDTARVAEMLEKAEFLIAHNAEFAQSFVCRLYESARTKHWKCSKKDIDWARLGMQSSEFEWLLKHHEIEMNCLEGEQNGAVALLHLLRVRAADGRPYLSQLLQE